MYKDMGLEILDSIGPDLEEHVLVWVQIDICQTPIRCGPDTQTHLLIKKIIT